MHHCFGFVFYRESELPEHAKGNYAGDGSQDADSNSNSNSSDNQGKKDGGQPTSGMDTSG